jgi:glycerol-3-phosphate dehydrogenase
MTENSVKQKSLPCLELDVAVVGGGITGAAIAASLASDGGNR